MWEILAIGDGEFLAQILNGVAMLANANTMAGMAALGALIGVIIIAIRAVYMQRLDLHYLLVGWIIVAGFIMPKAQVSIEDVESNDIFIVDNVPIGVAAIASMTSMIGVNITTMFETAFSTPSLISGSNSGFVDPLKVLLASRTPGMGVADLLGNAADSGVSMKRSLTSYIRDCTLYGIDMGAIPEGKIRNSTNLLQDIEVPSSVWTTVHYLDPVAGAAGTLVTCNDAYTAITNAINGAAFQNLYNAHMKYVLGGKPEDPDLTIQYAIDEVFPALGVDAQTFMRNNLIAEMLNQGEIDDNLSKGNTAAATLLSQAAAQRNVEMAAEGSLFRRFAKPAITFIEAFVYAFTPIVALLVMTGPFGITLAGNYIKLVAWVQLWPVTMSIINAYTHWVIIGKMSDLQLSGNEPASLNGLNIIYPQIADWIGTAGMLAAATPAISLMMVFGGAHAATHLASKLQSSKDYIDEKQVAPDLMKVAPVQQIEPLMSYSYGKGNSYTGAASHFAGITSTQMANVATSSLDQRMSQLQESTNSALSSTIANSKFVSQNSSTNKTWGVSKGVETSNAAKVVISKANEILGSHARNSTVSSAVKASLASGNILGLDNILKGSLGYETAQQKATVDQILTSTKDAISSNSDFTRSLKDGHKEDVINGVQNQYGNFDRSDIQKQVSKNEVDMQSLSKQRAHLESFGSNYQTQFNGEVDSAGRAMRSFTHNRKDGYSLANKILWDSNTPESLRQKILDNNNAYKKGGVLTDDDESRMEISTAMAIMSLYKDDPQKYSGVANELADYMSTMSLSPNGKIANPYSVGPVLDNDFEERVRDKTEATEINERRLRTHTEVSNAVDSGASTVESVVNNSNNITDAFGEAEVKRKQAATEASNMSLARQEKHLSSTAPLINDENNSLSNKAINLVETVRETIGPVADGLVEGFKHMSLSHGLKVALSGMDAAQQNKINAHINQGMDPTESIIHQTWVDAHGDEDTYLDRLNRYNLERPQDETRRSLIEQMSHESFYTLNTLKEDTHNYVDSVLTTGTPTEKIKDDTSDKPDKIPTPKEQIDKIPF